MAASEPSLPADPGHPEPPPPPSPSPESPQEAEPAPAPARSSEGPAAPEPARPAAAAASPPPPPPAASAAPGAEAAALGRAQGPGASRLGPETFRLRFRQFRYQDAAGPREAFRQLRELSRQWLRPDVRTKEQIVEMLVQEQLFAILPDAARARRPRRRTDVRITG
ncbi:SCAN domain-containing protein 1 [Suncus etruscus]|uniref:SCAN domain-containing protein 1 n=1 Tax=Suncus etruscus TaxID=109475 RepID=UPI00210F761E|nr:SCAN domain-containing protein 1 [Suncus etruscus]